MHKVYLAAGEPQSKHDRPSTWHHLRSWYPFHSAPNMLFLFYEDLVQVLRQPLFTTLCGLPCSSPRCSADLPLTLMPWMLCCALELIKERKAATIALASPVCQPQRCTILAAAHRELPHRDLAGASSRWSPHRNRAHACLAFDTRGSM